MRSNIGLQMVMAAYLAVATVGYVIVSYLMFGYVEPIGTIVIGFSVLLSLLIAFFPIQRAEQGLGAARGPS